MKKPGQHREILYEIAWQLMDLRQDVMFADFITDEAYPAGEISERLRAIQQLASGYADEQMGSGEGRDVVAGRSGD